MISPSRAVAAEVLTRVFTTDAFATAALDGMLARAGLHERDAALAAELVYGVLRTEAFLDEQILAVSHRGGYDKEPRARAHLLMGAYSLAFLDRVPSFAAVSEAVTGVRAASTDRDAAFANAVLRRLSTAWSEKRPDFADAVVASAPGWLRGSLRRSLGRGGAHAFLAAGPVPPPLGLCFAPGEDRAAWVTRLQEAVPSAEVALGAVSPRAIVVRGAGDLRRLPGFGEAWIVMEEGAQAVALAAGAAPGDRVLDACAGHGNKTWLLAQEVRGDGGTGAVDAADLFPEKLADLKRGPAGALVRATMAIDWTALDPLEEAGELYDVALVDAPCSGVGTLRRRPEIGRRRTQEDVARLADLQVAITRSVASRVRDGGRVVFATCSVLKEEAEEVIARLAALTDGGVRLEAALPEPRRFLPHVEGTDGYFVAGLRVRREKRRA